MSDNAPTADRPQKLEQVIAACLRAAELDIPIDQDALVARHPDLADHLRAFFAAQSTRDVRPDTATVDLAATRPLIPSDAGEALQAAGSRQEPPSCSPQALPSGRRFGD